MEMKPDPSIEADDDVFYAELRRQILVLTSENDDEDAEFPRNNHSESSGAKRGSASGLFAGRVPGGYLGWSENNENSKAAATWPVDLWRHGNGTGVFIPHIAKSRRRHKNRKEKQRWRNNIQASGKQELMKAQPDPNVKRRGTIT